MSALAFLAAASHGVAGAAFDVYENADNTYQRRGAAGVTGLGPAANASGCQQACVHRLGADPTTGCA